MPRGRAAGRTGMPCGGIAGDMRMPQCHFIPIKEMGAVRCDQLSRGQLGSTEIFAISPKFCLG